MKDRWEQECERLGAEVAILREQVRALTEERARASTRALWGASKGLKFVLLPVCMLLATGGALYGQGAMDALFIDQRGNVGVGTSRPNATLDVAGALNVAKNSTLGGPVKIGTDLRDEGRPGAPPYLDVSGEVDNASVISLQLRSGNTNIINYQSSQIAFGLNDPRRRKNEETALYRHAIKTRHNGRQQVGNAIDFYLWKFDRDKVDPAEIGGLHTMTLENGNVGIGTTGPQAKLDVAGDVKANALAFASQKACSVFTDKQFRDTTIVPATWTKETCEKFRGAASATTYQLACIFQNDISFGAPGGGLPSQNCGW